MEKTKERAKAYGALYFLIVAAAQVGPLVKSGTPLMIATLLAVAVSLFMCAVTSPLSAAIIRFCGGDISSTSLWRILALAHVPFIVGSIIIGITNGVWHAKHASAYGPAVEGVVWVLSLVLFIVFALELTARANRWTELRWTKGFAAYTPGLSLQIWLFGLVLSWVTASAQEQDPGYRVSDIETRPLAIPAVSSATPEAPKEHLFTPRPHIQRKNSAEWIENELLPKRVRQRLWEIAEEPMRSLIKGLLPHPRIDATLWDKRKNSPLHPLADAETSKGEIVGMARAGDQLEIVATMAVSQSETGLRGSMKVFGFFTRGKNNQWNLTEWYVLQPSSEAEKDPAAPVLK